MMVVEIRNSYGDAAGEAAAATAPDTATNALCSRRDAAFGSLSIVRSRTASAASSALIVAGATALDAASGRARPTSSIGLPAMLPRRAAHPGYSSIAAAARSALRSSSVVPGPSAAIYFNTLSIVLAKGGGPAPIKAPWRCRQTGASLCRDSAYEPCCYPWNYHGGAKLDSPHRMQCTRSGVRDTPAVITLPRSILRPKDFSYSTAK